MLDYRTPRTPKTPIETETPFSRCGYWSVQNFTTKYSPEGQWLRICDRHNYGAAHEFALGYCEGTKAATGYKSRAELKYELIWIVGPDGHGYVCFEAPPPLRG